MKLQIETLSHKPLEFFNGFPEKFEGPRLPGAEVVSAISDFGQLCVQEFDGDNFIIRYSVLKTKQPFSVHAKSLYSGVYAVIMLRNEISPQFDHTVLKISESQFTILKASELTTLLQFPGREQFICLETLVSNSLMQSILDDFPELPFNINEQSRVPAIWVAPSKETDHEVNEQIGYIFTYSNPEKWRRNYYEARVWDIVWKLLAIFLNEREKDPLSPQKRKLAGDIQRIILDNLDEHLLIKELASKVGVSESILKDTFSKAYGMGVHEFRIYQRLKKAIQLLRGGMNVNEAALETGWRAADLIRAYVKVYGTTPGTLKKKK